MIDCNVVQLDQPKPQAESDPGPRTAAPVLAGSKWSSWSNLFIELVKIVLRGFQQSAQAHQQRALLTCRNIPVQWDHLDQANRHAFLGRSNSCSRRRTTWTNSASQRLSQPSRRRRSMTTLRRASRSACLQQRGHVVHAAHCHAALHLLRSVHPTQHHRFTSSGRLYLKSGGKAGYRHATPHGDDSLAHRAGITAVVFVAAVAHARYGHPLRGPSGLHRVLFCEVVASHCAKAPFGVAYRWRARSGLQNPPYVKSLRWSLRSAVAVALVRRCSLCLVSGLRPVITCVPPPTRRGLAAARHWPPRAGCPSAPRGGSLNRASTLSNFAPLLT